MDIEIRDIRKELDTYSSRLSSGVRFLALGIIGGVWAILTADNITLATSIFFLKTKYLLTTTFASAVLALGLDLIQYLFAYEVHSKAHDYLEEHKASNGFEYSEGTLGRCVFQLYTAGHKLFYFKLYVLAVSAFSFLLLTFGISFST